MQQCLETSILINLLLFQCFTVVKTVISYTTMTNRKEHPKFHQTALEDE